jgi:signal transduction histidine kinase
LYSMRERAELLRADYRIVSQIDGGTTITLKLPLKQALNEIAHG